MYNYSKYEDFWNNPISDYKRLLEPYLSLIFKNYSHSSIIEIGFGSGHIAQILYETGFCGNYLGVDIDPNAVKFASQNLPHPSFLFEVFSDYTNMKNETWDLAIFCLSACEMSDEILVSYLECLKVKKLVIINPSTLTNYFESKITKPFTSKISSRLGYKAKWNLIAKIPDLVDQKRLYNVNKNSEIPASMYYRSLGDILNLTIDAGYSFEFYKDLKYKVNSTKTAPVSKFEVLWFEKQNSQKNTIK
jgi:SAM-dependent methyltransferase